MEWAAYLKFFAALAFVLALMGGLALLLRRFGLGERRLGDGAASTRRRLALTHSLPLDARRRAVLIKRDNVEHLVILGPSGETLIESGIQTPCNDEQQNTHTHQDNAQKPDGARAKQV